MHALYVAEDGFAPERHGAIHPHRQLGVAAPFHIPAKAGRNLDSQAQLPGAHAPLQLLRRRQRRLLDKIAGAGDRRDVIPALGRLVPVQHRKGQVFYIHGDAVAQNQHQQGRADKGKGHADRVPQQFPGFAPAVGQQPLRAEGPGAFRLAALFIQQFAAGLAFRFLVHRFQGGHEGAFQAVAAGLFDQCLGRVTGQYFTGVHQRNAVAALAFVHEVGGDKDGHPVFPGQPHQQLPEPVTGAGVYTGGGFIQNQQFRLVHHRHR